MPTVTWARVDPARRAAVVAAAEAEFGAHGFSGGSLNRSEEHTLNSSHERRSRMPSSA